MQTQNLQIIPKGVKPIIRASQSDVGRTFQLKLYDGAIEYTPPTGTTLRLDGIKPDGTAFSYTDNLTLSGSVITVTCKTQMTLIPGTVQCEIRMTKDSEDIGTINFDLMVEKSPINGTTDLSQTEVPALVALARVEMEDAEAWAVGTKDGEPVSQDDPQYENSAKYWAQQVGGQTQDAEAWAVGTKDGVPVTSDDPQYHNNAKYYSDGIHTDAQAAAASALVSEGFATGKQNGADVGSTSPYYHNNAAYYAGQAADDASTAAQAAARAEAAVVLEPYIGANGNWYVYDFSTSAYVDTGVDATGATGNGIASIAKTSTSGLVDTYTILYTNGQTTTFTVTNGADGQNGQDGATGNGIASITKTSTSGLVDTYTILYTNGQTTTFTVTNGQNGTGAGDMLAADYDPTQAVYNEGGIATYVAAQLSGFSTSLSGLSDVALASLATGQSLVYDATEQKWVNGSISASNVNYSNTTSGLTATKVQAAIDEVAAENQTLTNQVKDMNNVYGRKNLLPNNAPSQVRYGITFTVNDDGSVTANGTATNNTSTSTTFTLPAGNYILSGCPSGGSGNKYRIAINNRDTSTNLGFDYGSGFEFTLNEETNLIVYFDIRNGYTANNLTFYPMIRLASITDDTYEPYAKTNQQLTQDTTGLLENTEVNGAVNYIYPIDSTKTDSAGVTWTLNSDNSVSVSSGGIAPSTGTGFSYRNNNAAFLRGKTVTFKANVTGNTPTYDKLYFAVICRETESGANLVRYDLWPINGQTEVTFTIPNNTNYVLIGCNIQNGATTAIDCKISPIISLASYNGDYVPYAKSNKELTEDFIPKVLTVTPNSSYVDNNNLHATKYGQLVILSGYFRVHTEATRGEVLYTLPSSVGNFSGNASGLALGNNGSAILLIIGDDNTLKVEASDGISTAWYSIMMVMLNKTENI